MKKIYLAESATGMWRLMKETPENGVDTLLYEDPACEDLAAFDSAVEFFRDYILDMDGKARYDLLDGCEEAEAYIPVSNGKSQFASDGCEELCGDLIDWHRERRDFYVGNKDGEDKKIFYHDTIRYDDEKNSFVLVKWYDILTEEDILN